jgi:hypothetical protein
MKWDAEKFLRDISLDMRYAEMIAEINDKPVESSNIIKFKSSKSASMESPHKSVYVHLKNLVYTYGLDIIKYAIADITEENNG